ncbi:MAG: ORF6N domain-containing protein [Candidatus Accumulibacter sp.]|nr:ORF6N domain-containing protein [Accumulibacter sp.]
MSHDLARLYGVEPRVLMQAVKRNIARFPADFMFHLSSGDQETLRSHTSFPVEARPAPDDLKSQIVISSWGGRRYAPYAFTEQGIAMLSSVLRSSRAIQVNIEIMRAFVRLRRILSEHKELSQRLDELESRYDSQFRSVFEAIRQLMTPPDPVKNPIGFTAKIPDKEKIS